MVCWFVFEFVATSLNFTSEATHISVYNENEY